MKIGSKKILVNNSDISELYFEIAKQDEIAANNLVKCGLFNQAGYFYIQAMEKYIKSRISLWINVMNPFLADEMSKTIGHSLDESLSLLIKVFAGNNELLALQMNQQIFSGILKEIRFEYLHNSLRYPIYIKRYGDYISISLKKSDCEKLHETLQRLKTYLDGLNRM